MENRTLNPIQSPATRAPHRAATNTSEGGTQAENAAPSDLLALTMALRLLVAAFEAATTSKPALALLAALRGLLAIVAHHQADPENRRLDAFTTDNSGPHPFAGLTSLPIAPPKPAPTPAPSSPPSTSSSSTTRSTAEPTPAPSLPPGQRRLWSHLIGGFEAWGQIGQTLAVLNLTVGSLDDEPDQLGLQSELTDRVEELRAAHLDLAMMLCEASAEVTGISAGDNPVAHAAGLRELVDLDSPPWWIEHRRETILASAREAFAARARAT